jgi:hypothetical protein
MNRIGWLLCVAVFGQSVAPASVRDEDPAVTAELVLAVDVEPHVVLLEASFVEGVDVNTERVYHLWCREEGCLHDEGLANADSFGFESRRCGGHGVRNSGQQRFRILARHLAVLEPLLRTCANYVPSHLW